MGAAAAKQTCVGSLIHFFGISSWALRGSLQENLPHPHSESSTGTEQRTVPDGGGMGLPCSCPQLYTSDHMTSSHGRCWPLNHGACLPGRCVLSDHPSGRCCGDHSALLGASPRGLRSWKPGSRRHPSSGFSGKPLPMVWLDTVAHSSALLARPDPPAPWGM